MYVSPLAALKISLSIQSRQVCFTELKVKQTDNPNDQSCWTSCWTSSTWCSVYKIAVEQELNLARQIPQRKEIKLRLHHANLVTFHVDYWVFFVLMPGNADNINYFIPGSCYWNTELHGLWHSFLLDLAADIMSAQNDFHSLVQGSSELENVLTSRHWVRWGRVNWRCLRWGDKPVHLKQRLKGMTDSFKNLIFTRQD